jgi:hypothetical protein
MSGDRATVPLMSDEEIEMNGPDTTMELTSELASRMAVVAVTADIEFWARTVSVHGLVGVQDLTRTLEVIRNAAMTEQT